MFQVCYKDEFNKMMVKSLIKHKCRKVYGERLGILALGLPQDLRDLYFEQGKSSCVFLSLDCMYRVSYDSMSSEMKIYIGRVK